MLIILFLSFLSSYTSEASPSIDKVILRGVNIFGLDGNGNPGNGAVVNLDGAFKGITQTASGVIRTTSVSITTTSVQIVGANPSRRCLYVWNNSANSAYMTFGPTSSSASPTAIIATFTSFVMGSQPIYTGEISVIRNSGNGTMTTTECMP